MGKLAVFSEVRKFKTSTKTREVRDCIMALFDRDDRIYDAIEDYLAPPGKAGCKSFDQAYAVHIVLEFDREINNGLLSSFNRPESVLWKDIQAVLKRAGIKMVQGRVVGTLAAPASTPVLEETAETIN